MSRNGYYKVKPKQEIEGWISDRATDAIIHGINGKKCIYKRSAHAEKDSGYTIFEDDAAMEKVFEIKPLSV